MFGKNGFAVYIKTAKKRLFVLPVKLGGFGRVLVVSLIHAHAREVGMAGPISASASFAMIWASTSFQSMERPDLVKHIGVPGG